MACDHAEQHRSAAQRPVGIVEKLPAVGVVDDPLVRRCRHAARIGDEGAGIDRKIAPARGLDGYEDAAERLVSH